MIMMFTYETKRWHNCKSSPLRWQYYSYVSKQQIYAENIEFFSTTNLFYMNIFLNTGHNL